MRTKLRRVAKALFVLVATLACALAIVGCDASIASGRSSSSSSSTQVSTSASQATAASTSSSASAATATTDITKVKVEKGGSYYSKDEVAAYIYQFHCLPSNFITKNEAQDLGWSGGSVERYLEGAAIGGDVFKNREGKLPTAKGRKYYECDIDTHKAKSRGAKRIIFSNDGLIYYTDDHYETFTLLYGEE